MNAKLARLKKLADIDKSDSEKLAELRVEGRVGRVDMMSFAVELDGFTLVRRFIADNEEDAEEAYGEIFRTVVAHLIAMSVYDLGYDGVETTEIIGEAMNRCMILHGSIFTERPAQISETTAIMSVDHVEDWLITSIVEELTSFNPYSLGDITPTEETHVLAVHKAVETVVMRACAIWYGIDCTKSDDQPTNGELQEIAVENGDAYPVEYDHDDTPYDDDDLLGTKTLRMLERQTMKIKAENDPLFVRVDYIYMSDLSDLLIALQNYYVDHDFDSIVAIRHAADVPYIGLIVDPDENLDKLIRTCYANGAFSVSVSICGT